MTEPVTLSRSDLDDALEAAYRRGAEDLTAILGLPIDRDKRAAFVKSMHDAVGFVEALKEAKRVAIHAAIKWVTVFILVGISAAVGLKIAGK